MRKKWSLTSFINNLFWLGLFLGLLLFAITFNLKVGWFLIYFAISLVACSIVSLGSRLNQYEVTMAPLLMLNQGDIDTIVLQLSPKNGRLRISPKLVSILDFSDQQFELHQEKIRGESDIRLTTQIDDAVARGRYHSPRVRFISKDVFNLFQKTYESPLESTLMILPSVELEGSHAIVSLLSSLKVLPLAANFTKSQDVKALRDYREGDPFNQIDWKLSAKRDTAVVKEFENEHQEELVVLFYGNEGHFYEHVLALFYTLETRQRQQLGSPEYLMYDPSKEAFMSASPNLYADSQPIHMEKELIRGVTQANFNKKRLIILAARYSKDIVALSQEVATRNTVAVVYLDQKGTLEYELF